MWLDCFIFSREERMLRERVRLLMPHVDYFVIAEAYQTFTQEPKPCIAEHIIHKHNWPRDKFVLVKVTSWENAGNTPKDIWAREHQQREALLAGVRALNPKPHDNILLSDIDEIPFLPLLNPITAPTSLEQKFYYYNFRWRKAENWHGTIACPFETVNQVGMQWLRDRRDSWPRISNAGWHLSFWGDTHTRIEKLRSYPHQEYNTPDIVNEEHLYNSVRTGKDLFGRTQGDVLQCQKEIPTPFRNSPDPWFNKLIPPNK